MRIELSEKLQLLKDNYGTAKKEFRWDMAISNHFIALSYANKSKKIDTNRIKEVKEYIKSNTGVFSKFRGNNLSIMSSILSFEDDYESAFREMEKLTVELKAQGISSYEYSPMIAYTFLKNSDYENREEKIKRAKYFYEDMKSKHMFLTAKDDYVYAALLGCTDLDLNETCKRIEYIYKTLNEMGYAKSNGLQTVSHIIALGDDYDFRIKLFHKLAYELESLRVKIKSYNLSAAALMALVVNDTSEICNYVSEVYEDLKDSKGYKYSMPAYIKAMFSAMLVTSMYTNEEDKLSDISSGLSVQLIMVAQQQAMMAAIIASSAAASSSSS